MSDITIKQAQADIDQWIKTTGVRYFNELTNLGILMEEVGELSRLMVRKYGEQSFKETDKGKEISDEMADMNLSGDITEGQGISREASRSGRLARKR